MTASPQAAAHPGEPTPPAALPWPPELPDGLPRYPRVLQLVDADTVSHGASGEAVRFCLDLAWAAARALDPQARIRCAASSRTAARCLDVLTTSANNQWAIRSGSPRRRYLRA